MTLEHPSHRLDTIIAAKRERLQERRAKTPTAAVWALAEMQTPPHPALSMVTGGETIAVIGQITYGEVYDPVGAAMRYVRAGVDAVALLTDSPTYYSGLEDMPLVARAIKCPILYQDYLLDGYHVTEARAAGASAVTLYASVLNPLDLRRALSLAQRWRMTTLMQVETEAHMQQVRELSPHIVMIGSPDTPDFAHDLALFKHLRPSVPYNTHCMLLRCLTTLDEVTAAVAVEVDAVIVNDALLSDPAIATQFYKLIAPTA
ncbi:MAG: hypothetical protein H7Y11_13300 [Armatimonadetes bacterium]|nr:hypothetical protein [Anaerolineae bacterium]